MGRNAKPWHWAERNGWYATIRKRRRLLAKGGDEARPEANREFHRLMAMGPEEPAEEDADDPIAREVVDRFLDRGLEGLSPDTRELYRRRLREFRAACGEVEVRHLKPRHVNEWLASRAWGPGTRRTAIVIVRRAFAWATKQGYLAKDPTLGIEKPPETRREVIPTRAVVDLIMSEIPSPQFRDFFRALVDTGCRPGEVAKVEAAHIDLEAGTWTFDGKTTRKTGKKRVIYLTPAVVAISRRLMAEHPAGPVFRNTEGRPWKTGIYSAQLRRIRARLKLGPEAVAYAMRHLFVTDALDGGVPIATVAELVGHSSTVIIARNYSHLAERTNHLRDAVRKIRPDD